MKEQLLNIFAPLLALNPIIYVIIISLVPLIELRGAIPVAIALGFSPWEAFLWSVIGSIIPAFFVIPLFAWVLDWLKQKELFPALTNFLDKHFTTKAEQVASQNEAIEQGDQAAWKKELLKFWAIVVFVAVPLPGTGVYTGSAIASLIKMPFRKAFFAVLLGDIIAGLIVTAISMGAFALF
ncbi:small multi-drug export protein [bacterium]|nr:small multi-drug export protein [bacterium]